MIVFIHLILKQKPIDIYIQGDKFKRYLFKIDYNQLRAFKPSPH